MKEYVQEAAIVVGTIALCILALTGLHALLTTTAASNFDHTVQAWVHGWERPWVTRVMTALTWMGAIKIFSVSLALVLAVMLWRGRLHAAGLLAFAIVGAFLLNEGLKLHFHRARPGMSWSIGDEHTYSFPSGHSLFSVVLYGTLSWLALRHGASLKRRLGVILPAVLLPLSIGTSRIYLGEHWPTDVLAGWLCGGIWLGGVIWLDSVRSGQSNLGQEVKRRLSGPDDVALRRENSLLRRAD